MGRDPRRSRTLLPFPPKEAVGEEGRGDPDGGADPPDPPMPSMLKRSGWAEDMGDPPTPTPTPTLLEAEDWLGLRLRRSMSRRLTGAGGDEWEDEEEVEEALKDE